MTTPKTQSSRYRTSWEPLVVEGDGAGLLVASGVYADSYDPATTELVARVRESTLADVDEAVTRAKGVNANRREWGQDAHRRARVLQRLADSLRQSEDRLAELLTREEGKTIAESRTEVNKAADLFGFYAGLARSVDGRALNLNSDARGMVTREPMGVVAIVVPWNSPLILLARALGPALAAGNTCIVKPASLTPAITASALAPLAADPEMPSGTVTCVIGPGSTVGAALAEHAGVDMVSFTGSTDTGIEIMKRAADSLKKVCLELGGKSPNVVFADADLEKAVAGAQAAIFSSSGQSCTAGSRLLVQEEIYDHFVSELVASARALKVGDGLDPTTDLGPLVSRTQRDAVSAYIDLGGDEGTILLGEDSDPAPDLPGWFVPPTIVADLPADSRLIREEIFGPVLTVQSFSDESDAVALANDTEYGLAAAVWTQNLDRAFRVGGSIEAGTVWVNTYHRYFPEAEGGGFKRSGIGRQQGLEGLHEYTQTRHLNFDTSQTGGLARREPTAEPTD
jgi:betaine-aldehyde dehydrogenase